MIQTIGLIVAVYALARLLQVPMEAGATKGNGVAATGLVLVSVGGFLVIGLLTLLLLNGTVPQTP